MASFNSLFVTLSLALFFFCCSTTHAQLSATFYATSCLNLATIVSTAMNQAVTSSQQRAGSQVLRLFFHGCFVQGCDASVLLDDVARFTGEKTAGPNQNSLRGSEFIDAIKTSVEAACNATVSCADILALTARDGEVALGGPTWTVQLGRRDSRTASLSAANSQLPNPNASLAKFTPQFSAKGFNACEMTVLSGAHTIGQARCTTFRNRIYNDTNIAANLVTLRQRNCPRTGGDGNFAPLDVSSAFVFDNTYYQNLVNLRGLLHSDKELFNNGTQDSLVQTYSTNEPLFRRDFAAAMVKMSNISPLNGANGEIRRNCRRRN